MEYMQEMNVAEASVFSLETLLAAYKNQTVLFAKVWQPQPAFFSPPYIDICFSVRL